MSSGAERLRGLSRWATVPSTVGGLAGAFIGAGYAAVALSLPEGTVAWFVGIVAVLAVITTVRGDFQEQRALGTVRALGDGKLPIDTRNLQAAVREAFAFPDRAFWINFQNWLLATTSAGVLYGVLRPEVGIELVVRIALLGLALAPLTSLLTHVLVISRCRRVVERLAEAGLSEAEVIAVAPPKRAQLRARLMAFTAIVVLTPSVLIADLIVTRTNRAIDQILEQTTHEAQCEVARVAEQGSMVPIAAVAAVTVLAVVAAGFAGGTALASPLERITGEARRIASGDLTDARPIPAEDEIWAASVAFGEMRQHLVGALGGLKQAGMKISATTAQLMETSRRHEAGAAEQAGALTETSATTEELARSARHISVNASVVAQMAEQTLAAARDGRRGADAYASAMARMREGNQAIADAIVKLNKRVQQIGRIVEFIDGIADKCDLLALNAELEGSKAGEVGRGFSLVAAEMRRLAESVMESTREISRLIDEIRDATNAAVMATEAGLKASDRGAALSGEVSHSLEQILALADQTTRAVKAISAATQQQEAATAQVAETMAEILRVTQSSAAHTRESALANADLSNLALDLRQVVERFRVS